MTTHRMDEAERLCDQIAIMVNGRIVCYGSPAYLMDTYGGGYEATFTIDVEKSNKTELAEAMMTKLPNMSRLQSQSFALQSEKYWIMNFKLSPQLPISRIFAVLTEIVDEGHAEYFTATRTSLD
jgi:ABC-type multidrug transport system ATPase subunit